MALQGSELAAASPTVVLSALPDLGADGGAESALRRWARSLELGISGGFVLLMILACFFWPLIYHVPPPVGGNIADALAPPLSPHHLFGTDGAGNDVFSRILYGGRVSFEIAGAVQGIGLAIGSLIGTVSALRGGWVDVVLMRILDVFIAFPALVLALAIAEGLGPSEIHVIWAISFFSIPAFGRVSRVATLRLREQNFMVAADLVGSRKRWTVVRHVLPNIFPRLVTFALLGAGITMIIAGTLSFLGVGVPAPGADWGNMIASGQQLISAFPDLVIIPSAFLLATVVALNAFGDALRRRWAVQ